MKCFCFVHADLSGNAMDDLFHSMDRRIPESLISQLKPLFGAPKLEHDKIHLINFDSYSSFHHTNHTKEEMTTFIWEEVFIQTGCDEISLFDLFDCNIYVAVLYCVRCRTVHYVVGIDFTINPEFGHLPQTRKKRCDIM